ncbi:type IV secretory system conjugative DNA transfer family protein [Alicyclobacillus sp. SP_1]|uniref:type IV secretory system conjugative DNA transfer family protein n=1 Tax=Alicyclobacillus sp. SP_1 TaxID=2942475 RepID=UPI002157A758|nr:TraM recognition domain-containing protein [Alicyclobacillus sp. SP_1]
MKTLALPQLMLPQHVGVLERVGVLLLAVLALWILSAFFRIARGLLTVLLVGIAGYGLMRLAKWGNKVGRTALSWRHQASGMRLPVLRGALGLQTPLIQLGDLWVLLLVLGMVTVAWIGMMRRGYGLGYAVRRVVSVYRRPIRRGKAPLYETPDVVIGLSLGEAEPGLPGDREKSGKKVILRGSDRCLNMGIVGPIGSGKTYRTMKPMIHQDLEAIAKGTLANVLWMSPQPEPSIETYAESLGITVRRIHVIDGQVGGKGTNVRFNPLAGATMDDIVANMNILLNEQTGDKARGAAFFDDMAAQATTDSLQLYRYLYGFDTLGNPVEIDVIGWYDRYLVQMDDLFMDAARVRAMAHGDASTRAHSKDARLDHFQATLWPRLSQAEHKMLERAANSIYSEFGGSVDGKNAEAYKNILRGLRGKVRVLISSPLVQALFGHPGEQSEGEERPNFSFESWIDPPEWMPTKDATSFGNGPDAARAHPGELLSVITGQTETGKLVGRMILVFLQQAVLHRPGKDNDKPPVYTYVDEYPLYATRSIQEIRTQGRKHGHQMVMAMQSRAQMEEVGRGYLHTMEGSTRHWIYLSNLGYEDARFVSQVSGSVSRVKTTRSARQIRAGGLGKDDGHPLVTKSHSEEKVPRFSIEYLRYGLTEHEALYVGVSEQRGQLPQRIRMIEPTIKASLQRKVARASKTSHTAEKRRPISVYPSKAAVARAKRPLFTWGSKTLYVYRYGVSFEADPSDDVSKAEQYATDPPETPTPKGSVVAEPRARLRIIATGDEVPAKNVSSSMETPIEAEPPMRQKIRMAFQDRGKAEVASSQEELGTCPKDGHAYGWRTTQSGETYVACSFCGNKKP